MAEAQCVTTLFVVRSCWVCLVLVRVAAALGHQHKAASTLDNTNNTHRHTNHCRQSMRRTTEDFWYACARISAIKDFTRTSQWVTSTTPRRPTGTSWLNPKPQNPKSAHTHRQGFDPLTLNRIESHGFEPRRQTWHNNLGSGSHMPHRWPTHVQGLSH